MLHTLSLLVDNKPGTLARVCGLIARRGFNIESLAVGTTENPHMSRMTVVVDADETSVEQITKQLHKLINTYKIQNLAEDESINRELALFKVKATPERRHEIIEIANVFRASVVDVGHNTLTIEATGDHDKLQALEDLFREFGIKEVVRTGKIALSRGSSDS